MEEPEYYTSVTLAAAAGVDIRTLFYHLHESRNVGGILAAREKHAGLGVRYLAKKCRKYIALCRAKSTKPKPA